jgi:cell division protein FtsZ
MGVGEDNSLDTSISVTVIATGFNAEQQQEIVHADPQKIIHTLDDEQSITQDLTQKNSEQTIRFQSTESLEKEISEPIITHHLEEDVEEQNPLIPTTEVIKNIEIDFEEVHHASQDMSVDDFVINDVTPKILDFDVIDPETVTFEPSDQFSLSFDLPLADPTPKETNQKIVYDLEDTQINDIEVNDAIQLIPVTEIDKKGTVKYSLDDYVDDQKSGTNPSMVKEDLIEDTAETKKEINPLNSTISDLAKRTAERKITLKEFNHKFYKTSRIDELEKEPAFKRAGVDLSETSKDVKASRTSVSTDSNEGVQLRTNNSFLHDNVD